MKDKKDLRSDSAVSWMIHSFPRRTKEKFKALCSDEGISLKKGLVYVLEDWMANFKKSKSEKKEDT